MKILLTIAFLFFIASISAQEYFVEEKCSMQGVTNVDSVSAAELYKRAKFVLTKVFKSAKDVTQFDDDDNKQVVAKGWTSSRPKGNMGMEAGRIWFSLKIQCKDGRYRYEVYDCTHEGTAGRKYNGGDLCQDKPDCGTLFIPKKIWGNIKIDFIEQVNLLVKDIQKEMANASSSNTSNDW